MAFMRALTASGGGATNAIAGIESYSSSSPVITLTLPFAPTRVAYIMRRVMPTTSNTAVGFYDTDIVATERDNFAAYYGTNITRTTPSGVTINGNTVTIDTTKMTNYSTFDGYEVLWSAYA